MLKTLTIPALIAISFSFVNPCSQPKNDEQPTADNTVYEVSVIYPQFASVPKSHQVEGVFDVSEVDYITANADAEVDQIYVNVGDAVVKDDPVTSLTNTSLIETIDLKRAKIKELQARLKEAQGKLEFTSGEDIPATIDDTVFMDEDPLDQPVQKQFGDANAQIRPKTQKDLIEVLESTIDSLSKQADILDRQLLDLTQNSPVTGIITNKLVTEGNKVKQQDKLIEISKTDPLSVTFYLPDNVANFIDKRSTVRVSPLDDPETTGTGTVYFINPKLDSKTGKIEVRAHVSNPESKIKGGQKAKVSVTTRKMDRVIVLPKRVLYHEGDKTYVFIAYRNQAKLAQVTPGQEDDKGNIQISGDLRIDDPIIIDRPPELAHNSFIKLVKTN